jgi:hypothetical protein
VILRATELFEIGPQHLSRRAAGACPLHHLKPGRDAVSIPAGRAGDRVGTTRVLAAGAALFALAYVGIRRHPRQLRAAPIALLAIMQSAGNLAASAVAGAPWTLVSPAAAFIYGP